MIAVESRAGRYEVHCRWGALDDLGPLMREAGLRGSAFVVSDDAVACSAALRVTMTVTVPFPQLAGLAVWQIW